MKCSYLNNQKKCFLLTTFMDRNGFYVSDSFCGNVCGPNNPEKQQALLRRKGIMVDYVPPTPGELDDYLKDRKITYSDLAEMRLKKSFEEQQKQEHHKQEITAAVAQLPPLAQRLVSLDNWIKDIAVPFEKQTGLLFTKKDHKLERDEICRQCPHMVKESDTMSCSKCGCRMGKLVADPNEPDPHEIMGKLGKAGKTADAVRIKSASWYAAKKCGNWQEDDRWAEIDARHMTPEQLKLRDELYAAQGG